MSSQRGNVHRNRPQKHQNRTAFKNDRHDTNIRTKRINQIQITNVCMKCKAVLEWKIKYKKYKLIKAPRTCNKCGQKTVKQPYHVLCSPCARSLSLCPKCELPMTQEDNSQNQNTDVDDTSCIECDNSRCSDSTNSDDDSEVELCDSESECAEKISKIILNS